MSLGHIEVNRKYLTCSNNKTIKFKIITVITIVFSRTLKTGTNGGISGRKMSRGHLHRLTQNEANYDGDGSEPPLIFCTRVLFREKV